MRSLDRLSPLESLRGTEPAPLFEIQVDGTDITAQLDKRLISLNLTDNRGFEADTVELVLDDSDGKLDMPRRGATLSMSIGWQGQQLMPKGQFTVDELEHTGAPDTLSIRGKSVDMRDAMQAKRETSFHKQSLGTIISSIAARHQLSPAIQSAMAGQAIEHIDQHESDAAFLSRLAKEFDAIATVKQGKLVFIKAGQATTASGQPLEAVIINRQSGDGHRFTIADRDAYTGVMAYWHDHKQAQKKQVKVKRRTKKASTTTTTDASLPTAHVHKKENELLVGSRENTKTLRHIYANQRNAERAARAEWERLQRGVAQFSLTLAKGRPELFPELPVTVKGFKPQIDAAAWIITRVVHHISGSGYINELELEIKLEELPE